MVIAKLIRLCLGIVKKILKVAAVVTLCLVILSLIPSLPPYIEYNAYNVTPPVPLKGTLGINTLLNNAERLYEGALKGPEAFDVYNGVLYTGLHGGEVVKLVDGNVVPVAKFGQPCEGFWEEKKCGRPLGIKFDRDGFLYVADAYYGLYKVNVNDGTKMQLVSVNDFIEDKPVKLPNSVDIAEDGTVYWTISSSEFPLEDGVFDMLADGSGRLLRYDPKKKTNEVLIDNLHFANGVVLSSNEEFVLVAETARSRIHRYYLKGPKKGVHDIFLDGLPGLPDNLKSDGSSGFFIPLVCGRDSSHPLFFQSLGPFPSIRRAFSRLLALLELFFWQIDSVYPNYYAKRAIHFVGHFESMSGLSPKRNTILHVEESGKIKSSYHATDGKLTGISEIHWFNGAFYLGSPYNTYVGRVALDVPELQNQKRLPIKEEPVLKKQAQDQGQLKKQTKQGQEKRPMTEEKLSEPIIQQTRSAQDKKPVSSDTHQQKLSFKEEKVPLKQQKEGKKEQNKPVEQQKQPLQQQKEQPKVQYQTPQKKTGTEEKLSVQQQKPHLQPNKETVNEGKLSAGQQKPQPAVQKPPLQQQKQQSAEAPRPAAHQQKQQQQQRSTEVPKSTAHQKQQQERPAEIPKPAAHQHKQHQQQRATEVPKPTSQQQKQQSAEALKPAAEQQRQQQQSAGIPKSAAPQQKQQQKHSTEVPKPATQQQKQQPKHSTEVPKPAAQQQKQQPKHSTEVPKPATQQQKLEATDKKVEVKQQKQLNEQKTVPHQKPQAKETKPQVQQQRKPVKEEALPMQQKEQPVKHTPAVQQQKYPTKEEQPVAQQQKKTADQKAANQQKPVKVQKASVQQPVSQVQGKKATQQEKSSPQQEQPPEAIHQKPKVQDKTSTKEQHPPK